MGNPIIMAAITVLESTCDFWVCADKTNSESMLNPGFKLVSEAYDIITNLLTEQDLTQEDKDTVLGACSAIERKYEGDSRAWALISGAIEAIAKLYDGSAAE